MSTKKKLTRPESDQLIAKLKSRFDSNMARHKQLDWKEVEMRLTSFPEKLWSLHAMEISGGEPDVVDYKSTKGQYVFFDCSAESPVGRRSVCYDGAALESRKEHKPANNAIDMAAQMGVEILNEAEYKLLQKLGEFDTKTSSWIYTPPPIRKLGGALFADRRYKHVFIYHNGASSYYAARAFRASLII